MKKLLLLALLPSCTFHAATKQEQDIGDYVRRNETYEPASYEPISFGTWRKCRAWELMGSKALPGDTQVVGLAVEHVFRIKNKLNKVEVCRKDYVIYPDGQVDFVGH